MKKCTKCGLEKSLSEFKKRSGTRSHLYESRCKQCDKDYKKSWEKNNPNYNTQQSRKWRKENPERSKELNRKAAKKTHTKLRKQLIDAYGGMCSCCGEADPHFLTIEHKAGRGKRPEHHRGVSGTKMLYLIRNEGFPDQYTLLCWNCNCSLGLYGFCPHQPHAKEQRRYE